MREYICERRSTHRQVTHIAGNRVLREPFRARGHSSGTKFAATFRFSLSRCMQVILAAFHTEERSCRFFTLLTLETMLSQWPPPMTHSWYVLRSVLLCYAN